MQNTRKLKISQINNENTTLAEMRNKFARVNAATSSKITQLSAKTQKTRQSKLEGLLERLRRGENVQNSQLKRWLSSEEYDGYIEHWQSQLDIRAQLKDKPAEITEYENMLRKAMLFENRADGYGHKHTKTARVFVYRAEICYESAIEYLEESLSTNPSLAMWLDRQPDFSAGGNIAFESGGVPLVVTSRSLSKQGSGMFMGKVSKQKVKIDVIERAIDAIN